MRLLLLDGYKDDDPVATAKIKNLEQQVPTLFASMMPHDHFDNESDSEDEGDPPVTVRVDSDEVHRQPGGIFRIKGSTWKELGLPVREKEMSYGMDIALERAYKEEYNKNVIIPSDRPLKWWKKVSFSTKHIHVPPDCIP